MKGEIGIILNLFLRFLRLREGDKDQTLIYLIIYLTGKEKKDMENQGWGKKKRKNKLTYIGILQLISKLQINII